MRIDTKKIDNGFRCLLVFTKVLKNEAVMKAKNARKARQKLNRFWRRETIKFGYACNAPRISRLVKSAGGLIGLTFSKESYGGHAPYDINAVEVHQALVKEGF